MRNTDDSCWMKGGSTMRWTDFSKKVVAGAFAPVLAVGMMPAVAFAADSASDSLAAASIEVVETSDALTTQADVAGTFTFSNDSITASDGATGYETEVDADNGAQVLTIKKAGTYVITGSCSKGQIAVKKGLEGVTLVLQDLTLANDGDKAIKFKAGSSGTIELQGTNTLSTTNDKGIIKANAVEAEEDVLEYDENGYTTGGDLVITGTGTLNLSSDYVDVVDGETEDCDAINCEGDLTVLSGTFNIDVTDDGMHADNTLTIGAEGTTGPTINVNDSTEGLEGATVTILSGTGKIVSTDDGINAANADLTDYSWPYAITIAGGSWTVNAGGDGLDSNGNLTISGGDTVVYGSTSGGNGVFDIGDGNYSFSVTGGTLLGMGTSDMAITPTTGTYVVFGAGGMSMGGNMGMPGDMNGENSGSMPGQPGEMGTNNSGMGMPGDMSGNSGSMGMPGQPGDIGGNNGNMPGMGTMSDDSTEASDSDLSAQAGPGGDMGGNMGGSSYTITAGQTVTVKDSAGNVLASTTAAKNAQWVLYASNDLVQGQTYTLNANDTQLATASAVSGSAAGGNQDGMQPGQGGQPGQGDQGQQQGPGNANNATDNERVTSGTMHRLYNPNTGEHFYTPDDDEYASVVNAGWTDEGMGWTSPETGDPVYRLYNPYAGEHHYTLDEGERAALVNAGWTDEGIGWFSDPAKGVPLYREYNPNMFSCNHNYTADATEHANLVALGWIDEGIAWYGVA